TYRFDPFLLLTEERLLMREGRIVPLSPKVLETLLILVENSGRILSKEELMQSLWPDTFVEESNLTQNISQVRKALGGGEWVETIAKRGYRLAAPVQVEAEPQLANGAAVYGSAGNGHAVPSVTSVAERQQVLAIEARSSEQPNRKARWAAAIVIGLATLG